eukprot:SAG11_NODE_6325_length_1336_cov_1.188359_2_plen_212_part_00
MGVVLGSGSARRAKGKVAVMVGQLDSDAELARQLQGALNGLRTTRRHLSTGTTCRRVVANHERLDRIYGSPARLGTGVSKAADDGGRAKGEDEQFIDAAKATNEAMAVSKAAAAATAAARRRCSFCKQEPKRRRGAAKAKAKHLMSYGYEGEPYCHRWYASLCFTPPTLAPSKRRSPPLYVHCFGRGSVTAGARAVLSCAVAAVRTHYAST